MENTSAFHLLWKKFNWPTLEDRRKLKDCHTLGKTLTHDLEVNSKLLILVNLSYHTRSANIRHTINTDAMKYSFFNRTMEFYRHLFLSLISLAFYLYSFVTSLYFTSPAFTDYIAYSSCSGD